MPRGFFTQSACVLLSKPTTLDAVAPLLSEFQIAKRIDQTTEIHFGGPSLIVAYRPEVNGYVNVDIREGKWPDGMGDPKTNPMLFGAWSMGHYGPFTFPGSLQRAQQQLWSWPAGKEIVPQHIAGIHMRASYVFGAGKDATILPPDYDALGEMHFITRLAVALMKHPNALAYFNPNGEILADAKGLTKSLEYHAGQKLPPFDIWVNVRLLNPNNGWMIMDTVGMEQLERPDLEACFPAKKYDPGEVSFFLRNCSLYLLNKGEVIKDQDTMNGPGNINWRAHHVEKELSAPPRRLIRWFPMDGSTPPSEMTGAKSKPTLGDRLGRLLGRKS